MRRVPPANGLRRSDGTSSARNPPKLSEVTRPRATSSPSAASDLRRSRPVAATSSSKNDAPCVRRAVEYRLRPRARLQPSSGAGQRRPERRVTTCQQRDRRGAHRRRDAVAAVAVAGRWAQSRPGDASREALVVQPGRLVCRDAGRQDFGLPRSGRRFETFEQCDGTWHRIRTLQPRVVGHALPGEQEAQEVARGDRFDLGAQTPDRVVMNAREQTPVAPFVGVGAGGEAAAQGEALDLQRDQRGTDLVRLQSERSRQRALRSPDPDLPAGRAGSPSRLRSGDQLADALIRPLCDRGRAAAPRATAPGTAAAVRRRPRASPARSANRVTRSSRASSVSQPLHPARPAPPSALRQPSHSSASCSSSALAGSGQASVAHPRDRLRVEPAKLGRRFPGPASAEP